MYLKHEAEGREFWRLCHFDAANDSDRALVEKSLSRGGFSIGMLGAIFGNMQTPSNGTASFVVRAVGHAGGDCATVDQRCCEGRKKHDIAV